MKNDFSIKRSALQYLNAATVPVYQYAWACGVVEPSAARSKARLIFQTVNYRKANIWIRLLLMIGITK